MADITIEMLNPLKTNIIRRYKDMGDGTFAEAVFVEAAKSNEITVTQYSNTVLATLVTAVNAYLASSNKKLIDITHYAAGIASLTFYTIITER